MEVQAAFPSPRSLNERRWPGFAPLPSGRPRVGRRARRQKSVERTSFQLAWNAERACTPIRLTFHCGDRWRRFCSLPYANDRQPGRRI